MRLHPVLYCLDKFLVKKNAYLEGNRLRVGEIKMPR